MYLTKDNINEMKSRAFITGCTTLLNIVTINPDFYHVPIEHLDTLRQELRKCGYRKFRARFRGPRYDIMRLHCRKRDARAFSVYFDLSS